MLAAKIGHFRAKGFDPRSISGLAVWLDADDSASLYTTDAGPVTAVSAPTEISGCVLWLDGADASTVTASGGSVSEWRDKTAGARHFTASGAAQPTYTATLNGRNVLTFNGSTNTLAGNAAARDTIRNRAGYTFFAVSKVGSVAAGERLICGFGSLVVFRAGQNGSAPYAGGRRLEGDGLENITGAAGSLASGSSYITSAIVNHTLQSIAGNLNGSGFASDSTYMAAGNSADAALLASVGSQSSGYGFYNGDIAEVIIFDTALSTADRARVEAYLATKWGIANVHTPATATSAPVGYWGDKSGNGRHASQATAGNRPTRSGSLVNNLPAVSFLQSASQRMELGDLSAAFPSQGEVFVAYELEGNDLAYNLYGTRLNVQYYQYITEGFGFPGVFSSTRLNNVRHGSAISGRHVISQRVVGGQYGHRKDGAFVFSAPTTFDGGNNHYIGGYAGGDGLVFLNGRICEILVYSSALTDSQRVLIEGYLAAKWNVTLAPQVSNADAQSWINRVYANGGTVSTSTANAVNTFCNAIDSAGLRDRFFRLNLFCGTGLSSALVPLYRGQSLGGTQFGGTTDTNSNFVAGDYSETSGLKGNGSNKHLLTGLLPGDMGGPLHQAFSIQSDATVNDFVMGCDNAFDAGWTSCVIDLPSVGTAAGGATGLRARGALSSNQGAVGATILTSSSVVRYVATSPRTSGSGLSMYQNGTLSETRSPTYATHPAFQIAVFGGNRKGTVVARSRARLSSYSIGLDITAGQAAAYDAALVDFLAALGRATA